jgi:hypothetical protein
MADPVVAASAYTSIIDGAFALRSIITASGPPGSGIPIESTSDIPNKPRAP